MKAPNAPTDTARPEPAPPGAPLLQDDFAAATLGLIWVSIRSGDAAGPPAGPLDGHLRLALDTRGTDPKTLKVTGVRGRAPLPSDRPLQIEWRLDWNHQANGSYLKAATWLSPQATEGDPARLPNWIRVEHVGVPPGENWRHNVTQQRAGSLENLDLAGWPQDRAGRPPGAPRARLTLYPDGRAEYAEDDRVLSQVRAAPLGPKVYVYFTLTSHSNYPRREVFVDDVRVTAEP